VPFAEVLGRRVYFEEHGSGDPILLASGLGADHTGWQLQTDLLQQRFRVIVFDNPGVGQTEGPPGPYTSELFADVAAALLRHLGLERAHVVGASMGGIIAQQIALRHPALVRSLVLHCTWGRCDEYLAALFRSWQALARGVERLDLLRQIWLWVFTPRWYGTPGAMAEVERRTVENPYPQSADAFCNQAEACVAHDALGALGAITAPTLITVGDRDLLTPAYHSFLIKERIPGALIHVWPEMGHAPFWEIPDEFSRLNAAFLGAH
jgi:pimeloyl-ACP methyl ester carboxylesterase